MLSKSLLWIRNNFALIKYVLLITALVILFPINYLFFKGEPDNPIEKAQEAIIQILTGVSVDLSAVN